MHPLKLPATASLAPSAEQAMEDHHPNGALVLVQEAPESVDTFIPKSEAAARRRPSAEQATAQFVLEPMLTVCHVCPESTEEKARLIGSAPANTEPSAEQAMRPSAGALVNNDHVAPASTEM